MLFEKEYKKCYVKLDEEKTYLMSELITKKSNEIPRAFFL